MTLFMRTTTYALPNLHQAFFIALFGVTAVLLLVLPSVATAEAPGRFITARSDDDQLTVNSITLDLNHRSSDQELIDDGTIDTLEVEYDTDTSFNNSTVEMWSVADLRDSGAYSNRVFTVTIDGLTGVKGYYFRARLINTSEEVGEWKETDRIITLPPRPKKLRVPGKLKSSYFVTLRWNEPRRCAAEGCGYFLKIFNNRKKNKDLVYTSAYLRVNTLTLGSSSGLALGKKYRVKAQSCLESDLCNATFTKFTKFKR